MILVSGWMRLALIAAVAAAAACDKGVREPSSSAAAPVQAQQPAGPPPAPAAAAPAAPASPPPVGPPPEELATTLPASEIRESLPPLPMASFALPRPIQDVRLAYEFAGLHPEVLKYVPCFCGCERDGHPHNESCFVAARDAQGRVVSWDTHGMG